GERLTVNLDRIVGELVGGEEVRAGDPRELVAAAEPVAQKGAVREALQVDAGSGAIRPATRLAKGKRVVDVRIERGDGALEVVVGLVRERAAQVRQVGVLLGEQLDASPRAVPLAGLPAVTPGRPVAVVVLEVADSLGLVVDGWSAGEGARDDRDEDPSARHLGSSGQGTSGSSAK